MNHRRNYTIAVILGLVGIALGVAAQSTVGYVGVTFGVVGFTLGIAGLITRGDGSE